MPKIAGISNSLGCTSYSQQIEQHEADAHGYRRVRDIERPEVNSPPVHIDKIDDVAGQRAIDEVADRASENQRQAEPRDALLTRQGQRVAADGDERDEGNTYHDDRLEPELQVVQHPERGP